MENLTGFYRVRLVFGARSSSGELRALSSVTDAAVAVARCQMLSATQKRASSSQSAMILGEQVKTVVVEGKW